MSNETNKTPLETACSTIDLCRIITEQQAKIEELSKQVRVKQAVCDKYYARIDAFENFYLEARNLDPDLEEIAIRNKVDLEF